MSDREKSWLHDAAARACVVIVLVATIAISILALSLPSHSFYSGDPGLKLIAAFNAIEHPATPFAMTLPAIAGQPIARVDPMMAVHGDHAHVLQSPLFPVLSAPFIAIFGIRGAYVLPALGFIALIPLTELIRRRWAPQASFAALMGIVVLASPVFFYALEFWEHAPAVALLTTSTAAAAVIQSGMASTHNANTTGRQTRLPLAIAAGVLGAAAVLLRPEAAWYVAALGVVLPRHQWTRYAGGVLAVLVPYALGNFMHYGTALGPHAASNLAPLSHDWVAGRWSRLRAWFVPASATEIVALALIIVGWIGAAFRLDLRQRQLIALTGAVVIAMLAAGRMLPRDSFWQLFPAGLLALIPSARGGYSARLPLIAFITGIGVVLTATHEGGAQWGARYLLVIVPPLLILAASSATMAAGVGWARGVRVALIGLVLLAGLATSRAAYRELRGAKRTYARVVDAAAQIDEIVVTNVWWFDQITAALHGRRQLLYVPDVATATETLSALGGASVANVMLVWTAEPDGEPLVTAAAATCFHITAVREIRERQLRFATARCR